MIIVRPMTILLEVQEKISGEAQGITMCQMQLTETSYIAKQHTKQA